MKTIKLQTKRKKNKKGFSFIESMLAVFLVSVGIIAGLKLLTVGLKDSMTSRDQFTASLLAQEGVELVRNIRDNNWVDDNLNTISFTSPDDSSVDCLGSLTGNNYKQLTIDINGYHNCSNTAQMPQQQLCLNGSGYYINNVSSSCSTPTKFYRRIYSQTVGTVPNGDSRIITSVVTWSGGTWPVGFEDNLSHPAYKTTLDKCNTSNRCAYTQVTLSKWGE